MTRTCPPALDDYENARVEGVTVRTSLSAISARDVRIERVIQSQPNVVEQARKRGFYDFMLERPSLACALGPQIKESYCQGERIGALLRERLAGRAWYETEKSRTGGRWAWRIYREGYFATEGTARSETRADEQIEDAKADLMDKHADWRVPSRLAADDAAEDGESDSPGM